ncbi:DMT family transporter [Prevotella communis]|jgi:drug/metabolite transporter (DMT)-like permease|uniref:DMT family transporter n=1 Tax=Prevotella communis TaxID=2913614 RepID=UPI000B8566A3|nr:DMT family transporter [Prevotella communis]UKK58008.1 DMT family transporter [Prevotella communis]UKK63492.1 DMT family transporter [Prevotella communis]UKK66318.1 DMT family transporter [Prevotella communis]
MWLILAFLSAAFLGIYDSLKKKALKDNAVIPILFLNTLFSSLIFLPFILLSGMTDMLDGSIFHVASGGWEVHKFIVLKALIVLSSWILGYFGMKHLPLTIVGPINATRPVMVLVGALLFFGERLNVWQWVGVSLAVISFLLLSRSGKKEGIDFKHDHWIYMIVGAAALGAVSGLYDKYLMAPAGQGGVGLDRMMVQSWYNIYQCFMMLVMLLLLWWPKHNQTTPFHWDWAIIGVSVFLSTADFMYFYSLSLPEAMISIVSMVRRGSVIVSFLCGAMFFREKNLRAKAVDLALVLLGMIFLYIGSH